MAAITCGWCKNRCHMTLFGQVKVTDLPYFGGDDNYVADAAFECDGCGRVSVATWYTSYDPNNPRWRTSGRDDGPSDYEQARWSPPVGHQVSYPDVPNEIAQTATEAWTCQIAGAPRGAVMLARAVVESTAKAKGVTSGTLAAKIEGMANGGLIRKAVAEQAHEIRHVGNGTAHGDLEDRVTQEDAEEVLNLMAEVLNEVWQAPARSRRLAEARAMRAARQ
ncbi:DUF4145 domain-containing protein [Propioniciclava sp. MC1683]|uniref:DUF4145 domain-containing protein n=1 Tax=Propioniciclava sp. MC1683 TaxID=2760309 RepID=UPI0015FFDE74|nr:DUF4145 domain-containing protein [Propioniciclava sp. MC1683]MBB1500798.1 DUF4145 domain-containing protein [Propioniciclava sp. MC1683]